MRFYRWHDKRYIDDCIMYAKDLTRWMWIDVNKDIPDMGLFITDASGVLLWYELLGVAHHNDMVLCEVEPVGELHARHFYQEHYGKECEFRQWVATEGLYIVRLIADMDFEGLRPEFTTGDMGYILDVIKKRIERG